MSLVATESGGNFVPAPAGNHPARCFAVIDLGVQESPNFPAAHKIMLMWELPEEITEGDEPAPFVTQKEYTCSLNGKANLRAHLESWRGRPFTKEELERFEVGKLAGQPCFLNVAHDVNGKGKTYAKVTAVTKVVKGVMVKPQHHKSVVYEIEQGKNEVFEKLPAWIQKKIMASEEFMHPPIAQAKPEPSDNDGDNVDSDDVAF